MDRRSFLKHSMAIGATVVGVAGITGPSEAAVVRVRRGIKHWINRHRRYLHHHKPRRRGRVRF